MAIVLRSPTASVDANTAKFAPHLAGNLYAGEDITPCAPCYQKASDGKIYMSNGTAANEAAKFDGFAPRAYLNGEAITLLGLGMRMRYADSGLTPGADLYIGATAGSLDTAASVGDTVGTARAVSATDIRCVRTK